ncbi:unnamed protein product [Tilletia laevis]|uniref:Uncharacterized protein n=4 Tax=Tilletia TaxID=13289 RepID=A0A8X7MU71_9BASI|nr:hypothetical protein CF336_g3854 [Tilletia laevis]KAE8248587.1 hypothetical protein A4X06_0g3608 [Tilletia controversa]CAD6889804.1 unnamed protein product [Tilletia caries]CAD6919694.1 unnamed protein product [Tilletia controversa]CAD6924249.1 unnamed protein product [Tilletia caries]
MTESATAGTGAQEQEQVYLAFHLLLPRDYPRLQARPAHSARNPAQRDHEHEHGPGLGMRQKQRGRGTGDPNSCSLDVPPSLPQCRGATVQAQPVLVSRDDHRRIVPDFVRKALHASIVALATPPVNKSTSLDQQPNTNTTAAGSAAALNINENFRRTLDIETKARTLGPNLGGFSEQFHAQMQVASTKQRQQQ